MCSYSSALYHIFLFSASSLKTSLVLKENFSDIVFTPSCDSPLLVLDSSNFQNVLLLYQKSASHNSSCLWNTTKRKKKDHSVFYKGQHVKCSKIAIMSSVLSFTFKHKVFVCRSHGSVLLSSEFTFLVSFLRLFFFFFLF